MSDKELSGHETEQVIGKSILQIIKELRFPYEQPLINSNYI